MKTKTQAEVSALKYAWLCRVAEIADNWDVNALSEIFPLQLEIIMAAQVLQTGLTPETAEAFIEEKIAEFEKLAISRTTRKSPKRGRWPRRPSAPSL